MLKVVLDDAVGPSNLPHRWAVALSYVLVVSGILLSRESLVSTVKIGAERASLVYAGVLAGVLIVVVVLGRGHVTFPRALRRPWLVLLALVPVTVLVKQDFQPYYVAILLGLVSVGVWGTVASGESLMEAVSTVVTAISGYSLVVTYALRPWLFDGVLGAHLPRVTNLEGVVFYDLGLSFVRDTSFMFRNFGLFREPGAFAFFIAVALLHECVVRSGRVRLSRVAVLLLAMLSTMSVPGVATAALIVLLSLLVARDSSEERMSPRRRRLWVAGGAGALLALGLVVAVAVQVSPNLRLALLDMIGKLSASSQSNYLRVNAMMNDVQVMVSHPLFGGTFREVAVEHGITINSYFSVGAHFGVAAFAVIVWSQWCFARWLGTSVPTLAAGLLVFLAVIGTQYLITNPVYWLLVFSWALDHGRTVGKPLGPPGPPRGFREASHEATRRA